ncbi:MAG: CvpA family protein [bacterium]
MILDLLILGIISFFVFLGTRQKTMNQLINLISLLVATFAALKLYTYLGNLIVASGVFGYFAADIISWVFICLALYIGLTFAGRKYLKKIEEKYFKEKYDKIFGGILGGMKTLFIIVFVLFLMDVLVHARTDKKDALAKTRHALDNSFIASTVIKYNPFKVLKITKALSGYARLQNNPKAVSKVAQQQEIQQLLKNKTIKELINDKKLNSAIANRDYVRLLQNDKFMEVLRDKEAMRLLMSVDFENVFEEEK